VFKEKGVGCRVHGAWCMVMGAGLRVVDGFKFVDGFKGC